MTAARLEQRNFEDFNSMDFFDRNEYTFKDLDDFLKLEVEENVYLDYVDEGTDTIDTSAKYRSLGV